MTEHSETLECYYMVNPPNFLFQSLKNAYMQFPSLKTAYLKLYILLGQAEKVGCVCVYVCVSV